MWVSDTGHELRTIYGLDAGLKDSYYVLRRHLLKQSECEKCRWLKSYQTSLSMQTVSVRQEQVDEMH